ncbi:MAG: hypothetical protein HY078_17400 [Elusimicrobia bacterium]|nr:hypothetical protein [Elusimicrobiota bacterium]
MKRILAVILPFAASIQVCAADILAEKVSVTEVQDRAGELGVRLQTPTDVAGAHRLADYISKATPQRLQNGWTLHSYGSEQRTRVMPADGRPFILVNEYKAQVVRAPEQRRMVDPTDPENNFELPVQDIPLTSDMRVFQTKGELQADGKVRGEKLEYSISEHGQLYNVVYKVSLLDRDTGARQEVPSAQISPQDLYARWQDALKFFDRINRDPGI